MSPVQRLAVVDPIGNVGGGSRFVRRLLPALKQRRPSMEITFHGKASSMARDAVAERLRVGGVSAFELSWDPTHKWKDVPSGQRLRRKIGATLGMPVPTRAEYVANLYTTALRTIAEGSDVVYFPWPYLIDAPDIPQPMVCTVHDLNYRYWFGQQIFNGPTTARLHESMTTWLRRATPVTSSAFMLGEIGKFYPEATPAAVVRLAPFAEDVAAGSSVQSDALRDALRGHTGAFVLSVNNSTYHKNLGAVLGAFARLQGRHPDLLLVMVGNGTGDATGTATENGVAKWTETPNVIGLGYVDNALIDELIEHAAVVVNASLYEAGNGSGLDAWSRGTPVAMSNIPSFTEHLDALGVEAAVFDPRNATDIADKLDDVLSNPERWKAAAMRSQEAMRHHTWNEVADGYLEVFDRAAAGG